MCSAVADRLTDGTAAPLAPCYSAEAATRRSQVDGPQQRQTTWRCEGFTTAKAAAHAAARSRQGVSGRRGAAASTRDGPRG
eukprot:366462-Chlamydomonas_euryale.AAC.45